MHDWMFEPGGEPLTLPEPQPYAPEDSSWFAATPGGEDDWLVSLPTPSSLPDIEVPPPPRPTPGRVYHPGDYGGWDGYDSNQDAYQPQYTWEQLTDCINLFGIVAPDGATYVVPEGITAEYIMDAINYLVGLPPGLKEIAFQDMYTNRYHPHFLDFKEFYQGIATQTYYSQAAGGQITSSAFEPFGNFIYGFVGVLGGIDPNVLRIAAALLQEGDSSGGDAPEDIPHVELGIAMARSYQLDDRHIFSIGNCGD
jgi:hypothetical protein